MSDREKNVDTILQERGEVYGDYTGGLRFRLSISELISNRFEEVNGRVISKEDLMFFNDIIGKLSRLASSPQHLDSWKDLAGYATLVEEVIKNEEVNNITP